MKIRIYLLFTLARAQRAWPETTCQSLFLHLPNCVLPKLKYLVSFNDKAFGILMAVIKITVTCLMVDLHSVTFQRPLAINVFVWINKKLSISSYNNFDRTRIINSKGHVNQSMPLIPRHWSWFVVDYVMFSTYFYTRLLSMKPRIPLCVQWSKVLSLHLLIKVGKFKYLLEFYSVIFLVDIMCFINTFKCIPFPCRYCLLHKYFQMCKYQLLWHSTSRIC